MERKRHRSPSDNAAPKLKRQQTVNGNSVNVVQCSMFGSNSFTYSSSNYSYSHSSSSSCYIQSSQGLFGSCYQSITTSMNNTSIVIVQSSNPWASMFQTCRGMISKVRSLGTSIVQYALGSSTSESGERAAICASQDGCSTVQDTNTSSSSVSSDTADHLPNPDEKEPAAVDMENDGKAAGSDGQLVPVNDGAGRQDEPRPSHSWGRVRDSIHRH